MCVPPQLCPWCPTAIVWSAPPAPATTPLCVLCAWWVSDLPFVFRHTPLLHPPTVCIPVCPEVRCVRSSPLAALPSLRLVWLQRGFSPPLGSSSVFRMPDATLFFLACFLSCFFCKDKRPQFSLQTVLAERTWIGQPISLIELRTIKKLMPRPL